MGCAYGAEKAPTPLMLHLSITTSRYLGDIARARRSSNPEENFRPKAKRGRFARDLGAQLLGQGRGHLEAGAAMETGFKTFGQAHAIVFDHQHQELIYLPAAKA